MNKCFISLMVTVIFVFSSVVCVYAMEPDGNKRKGKYTYKNVYKACNERGEVESKTPVLSPGDKTRAQWQRVFEKKEFDIFKCSQEFQNLSEADLADIYAYLYTYAADSPTPAKCK